MEVSWLGRIGFWHWWVLGIGLIVLEVLSPGVFFLWIGIAAVLVGLLLLGLPHLTWEWQLLAFALFSVAAIALQRAWLVRHPIETDRPTLNRRGAQYLGRVFTLDAPIVDGVGKIRVDDTTWKVRGQDCPGGTKITVTGVDGVVLLVDRIGHR
jgi:inner membrane protein